jgi:hypothetical protein
MRQLRNFILVVMIMLAEVFVAYLLLATVFVIIVWLTSELFAFINWLLDSALAYHV